MREVTRGQKTGNPGKKVPDGGGLKRPLENTCTTINQIQKNGII